jgi:hypothetical protein
MHGFQRFTAGAIDTFNFVPKDGPQNNFGI